ALVIALSMILASMQITLVDTKEEINSIPTLEGKLSGRMESALSKNTAIERIDSIVIFNLDAPDGYIELTKAKVGSFRVNRHFESLKSMQADLTPSQVREIALLPYVQYIGMNTAHEAAECMDTARPSVQVDILQGEIPSLDGNCDGNLYSYSKDDIVIAVIDSGIDGNHVALDEGKVIGWHDVTGEYSTVGDAKNHGTHCAGIAAGTGEGLYPQCRGVAPGAALVGVKTYSNADGKNTRARVIAALDWVLDHRYTFGIEIVSISLGWGTEDGEDYYGEYDELAQEVDRVTLIGNLVCVVAAGNTDNAGADTIMTPGTAKKAITVGALHDEGGWALWYKSGRGPCDDGRIKPDLVAPGVNVWAPYAHMHNDYIPKTGTSMATPVVAGIVALMLDMDYNLRYDKDGNGEPDVKQLLMASAIDMGVPGKDNLYGAGRVDAWNAYYFYASDISYSASSAPRVINNELKTYWLYNQPLWARDKDGHSDWFKVYARTDWLIAVQAYGDPDLLSKITIYNYNLQPIKYSAVARNPGTSTFATYTGYYYIRIQSQSYTGDYYDISITTTLS
ncbi:MAG: S8 family serine peptidase, partial [Candidatus Thorarchaeota archaeon]